MADFLAVLLVFLAMVGYSNAAYCICKDGTSTDLLQKNIDFACGNGADCSQILQSGSCYNPNTVKDHCSYAVNSYFQKKNSTGATCDFTGTAIISSTAPAGSGSGCNYPSSAGSAGTGTSIAPPGSSTNPISTAPPGSNTFSGGLGPSGLGGPDSSSAGDPLLYQGSSGLLLSLAFIFLVSCLNGFIALNP